MTVRTLANWRRAFEPGRQLFPRARGLHPKRAPLLHDATGDPEKVLGPEHPDTAKSLNKLAFLLSAQGDFAGARPLYERALAIREKTLGPEHPDTATSLNNLANLLQAQGDFAGRGRSMSARWRSARRCSAPSIPIRRQPQQPRQLLRPGRLCRRHGRSTSARWRSARRRSAPSIPIRATSLNNLVGLLQPGRLCGGAAALRARAGDLREGARPRASRYGGEPQQSRRSLEAQGDFAGARPLPSAHWRFTRRPSALSIRSQIARAAICLAYSFSCGPPTEALALGETALAAHDKALGRDHAWTKDSARVTADALDALGRTEEAKALRERYGVTAPENLEPLSASK